MNISKYLVSAIAAVSVVGTIGFAYAQTTSETPANSTGPMSMPTPAGPTATPVEITPSPQLSTTPAPATTPAPTQTAAPAQPMPDSTINSAVTPPADAGSTATERAAQVDRN
jgi:hypothetical protein